jgi:two-component system alkaline phosphatase synthesis response regulator PhoP
MKMKILVIDDDALLRRSLQHGLEREGYTVIAAEDGATGLSAARHDPPNLVLLDIGLPDQSGIDLARTLQREMDVPIVFLTGRDQETDIVIGLEVGAEDYVTKPFGMRELLARIRVVLRRRERAAASSTDGTMTAGEIVLDAKGHEVYVRGQRVDLPPKEFELLRLLMANAGTVLQSDYLLNAVWGEEFGGALQVLYVHMGWLRERIEVDPRHPQYIQTVRGIGYKFIRKELPV